MLSVCLERDGLGSSYSPCNLYAKPRERCIPTSSSDLLLFFFLFFCLFVCLFWLFLGLLPRHMEVPRLGV